MFAMKRLIVLLMLCVAFLVSGCTMAESASEAHRRRMNIVDVQMHELAEDWDVLWLMDRPSELTPYHIRNGLPY
jgi:hypothetical protein